ncbi:hypothetical protein HDU84_007410 [Entophlyctis sp. JEL0112]|nr:hypothetical protein HDU84_007410 [Entophlyctis sp. JEL0112]
MGNKHSAIARHRSSSTDSFDEYDYLPHSEIIPQLAVMSPVQAAQLLRNFPEENLPADRQVAQRYLRLYRSRYGVVGATYNPPAEDFAAFKDSLDSAFNNLGQRELYIGLLSSNSEFRKKLFDHLQQEIKKMEQDGPYVPIFHEAVPARSNFQLTMITQRQHRDDAPLDQVFLATLANVLTAKYVAVSHVWGPTGVALRESLHVAANGVSKVLARSPVKVSTLDQIIQSKALPVWCDIFSINQDSAADKCAQVAIMDKIYANAVETITVLSQNDYDTLVQIEGVLALHQRTYISAGGASTKIFEDGRQVEQRTTSAWDADFTIIQRAGPGGKIIREVGVDGHGENFEAHLSTLSKVIDQLANMEYTTRVWTWQEAHLSKKVVYTPDGQKGITRHQITEGFTVIGKRAVAAVRVFVKVFPATDITLTVLEQMGLNKRWTPEVAFALIDAVGLLKSRGSVDQNTPPEYIKVYYNLEIAYKMAKWYIEFVGMLGLDYEDRCETATGFNTVSMSPLVLTTTFPKIKRECSVPKDYIFGHYKLLFPHVQFDYAGSIEEIYKEYQWQLINEGYASVMPQSHATAAESFISKVWTDVAQRTWANTIAGLGLYDRFLLSDRYCTNMPIKSSHAALGGAKIKRINNVDFLGMMAITGGPVLLDDKYCLDAADTAAIFACLQAKLGTNLLQQTAMGMVQGPKPALAVWIMRPTILQSIFCLCITFIPYDEVQSHKNDYLVRIDDGFGHVYGWASGKELEAGTMRGVSGKRFCFYSDCDAVAALVTTDNFGLPAHKGMLNVITKKAAPAAGMAVL